MMTNTQYLLTKVAEEASEIAQIALKTAQFGMSEVYSGATNPDGLTNAERLKGEINDLLGVVDMLIDESEFVYMPDLAAIEAKKAKVRTFREYSRSLGLVEPDAREKEPTPGQCEIKLAEWGFELAPRDPLRNPGVPGKHMVHNPLDDKDVTIVGDDLNELLLEAYEYLLPYH